MDTPNKSARFCSNILGGTRLQSLKSEKTRKISLVPIPRHESLADLFLILPGQLQMSSKKFHLYSFIKLSKNKALTLSDFNFTPLTDILSILSITIVVKCCHSNLLFPVCTSVFGLKKQRNLNYFQDNYLIKLKFGTWGYF